jgi:hypothetical protein
LNRPRLPGIATSDVRVTEAYGRPLRESRFTASKESAGRIEGSFKVQGPKGKIGEIRLMAARPRPRTDVQDGGDEKGEAEKTDVRKIECAEVVVVLPDGTEIDLPIVSRTQL